MAAERAGLRQREEATQCHIEEEDYKMVKKCVYVCVCRLVTDYKCDDLGRVWKLKERMQRQESKHMQPPAEHSPRAGVDPSNNDSDRKCIVTVSYSLIPVLMHITMSLHSSSMNTVIHNSSKLMAHAKGHGMF